MAFALILQKLVVLEQSMQSIPPLLKKIVDHLEAQTKQPEVPIATYAQLYLDLAEPETPISAAAEVMAAPVDGPSLPPARSGRLWRWFLKEG